MRGCFKAMLAFGIMATMAAPAMAQGRGGFGGQGGMGGPVNLLANPAVQKELKLDEAQVEKATKLATETREKMQGLRSQLEGLQGQEAQTKRAELAKPINDEAMKTAHEFLKADQVKRLHQIELQQRGANALTDSAVAKKVGITDEQATKVKTILADSQTEMRDLFSAAGDDRQAAMAKIQTLRKETNTKVMALLTDDQKKTWKEMTGEPFELPAQPRRNPNNN